MAGEGGGLRWGVDWGFGWGGVTIIRLGLV